MKLTPTETLTKHWQGTRFISSTVKTDQFKQFASEFKRSIKKELPKDLTVKFMVGHFYISGFFKNTKTDKYAYFNISDVRHFPGNWISNVLIRTAEHERDFTGGANRYCHITELAEKALSITRGDN